MCDISERSADESVTNGAGPELPDGVSRADLCAALASERRRAALSALSEAEGPIEVPALARTVAGRERTAGASPADERVERVHVALFHVDLPKLADLGVVDYDRDRGTVEASVRGIDALLADVETLSGSN